MMETLKMLVDLGLDPVAVLLGLALWRCTIMSERQWGVLRAELHSMGEKSDHLIRVLEGTK